MSFVIKRGGKYVVKGGIIGSETSDKNQAMRFNSIEEVKAFMNNEALRPEKHNIEEIKDAIIPNSAKTLEVTIKVETSGHKAGDKVILKRNDRGEWSDGKYMYPVNMLRTPEVCEVKVIDGLTAKERKELDYLRRKEEVTSLDKEERYRITELEAKMNDKKLFSVKYNDYKFKVFAKDHQDAANKIFRNMRDSSKLYELAYKLGQLANYFDRANSVQSRNILGREDETKMAEFFNLGLQTYNQLKFEVEQMKKAGLEEGIRYFKHNDIVDLLDDASSRMFWLREPKLKTLHEKLEPLIRDYERLVKNKKQYDAKTKDYAVTATRRSGTDKIIYALQSDVDKNLYFYIGATFSMKDGDFSYQKYEMNGVTAEALRAELLRNGWHEVKNYPQHIIDSKKVKDASKSRAAVENEVTSIKSEIKFLEGKLRRAETPAEKGEFAAQIDNLKRLLPKREEFLRTNEQWYTDESIEGDKIKDEYVKGPRGEFKLSEKTRSELEKEGYGFHHSFETSGGRYSVMVKNNTAVACRDSKVKDKMTVERMVQIITPIVKDFAKKKGVEDYWRIHKNGKNVSVGIELGYRGLDELCDVLNKKLAPLTESYFEPADAGLIETTIFD